VLTVCLSWPFTNQTRAQWYNKRHCSPFGRFLQRSCIYMCVCRLTLSRPQQHTDVSIHLFHAGLNLNFFFSFWGEKTRKNKKQKKKQSDSIGKFDWTLGMIIHSTPFSFFFPPAAQQMCPLLLPVHGINQFHDSHFRMTCAQVYRGGKNKYKRRNKQNKNSFPPRLNSHRSEWRKKGKKKKTATPVKKSEVLFLFFFCVCVHNVIDTSGVCSTPWLLSSH
jgi:hypothetical protein